MAKEIKVKNQTQLASASETGKFFVYITFILLFPILFFIATCNTFRRQQQQIAETASDIEVQLKKRFDLLTKLIDAVKASMKFEKTLQKDIVTLRNMVSPHKSITNDQFQESNNLMDSISSRLKVTLENYPDLKSVRAVIELQKQASDVEANIAAARRFYNTSVRVYNQRILTYPTNVAATRMKLQTAIFFEIDNNEQQDVKVNFN